MTSIPLRCALALMLGLLLALATGADPRTSPDRAASPEPPASTAPPASPEDRWAEVEKLTSVGRSHEALKVLEEIGEEAAAAGDEETRIRALVRATELRVGRDAEGAVEAIRASARPRDPVRRVAFGLLYADALVAYQGAQAWRIAERPRIESTEELPVAMDFFRFDAQGKIVEHWDAIQQVPEMSANGNTMY